MRCHKGPWNWMDYLDKWPKLKKMDIGLIWLRIGTSEGFL
jgi:hypothetical protein